MEVYTIILNENENYGKVIKNQNYDAYKKPRNMVNFYYIINFQNLHGYHGFLILIINHKLYITIVIYNFTMIIF